MNQITAKTLIAEMTVKTPRIGWFVRGKVVGTFAVIGLTEKAGEAGADLVEVNPETGEKGDAIWLPLDALDLDE